MGGLHCLGMFLHGDNPDLLRPYLASVGGVMKRSIARSDQFGRIDKVEMVDKYFLLWEKGRGEFSFAIDITAGGIVAFDSKNWAWFENEVENCYRVVIS